MHFLDHKGVLNIAHRGASAAAPANTLAAFERAIELGADGIEFDVHLSADGVPVVIHDFSVDATKLRPIFRDDLTTALEAAGFQVADFYGDYEFSAFDPQVSDDLIAVARR